MDNKIKSLEALSKTFKDDYKGKASLWEVLNSIHSDQATRTLVAIESVPLQSYYFDSGTGVYVFSLISITKKIGDEVKVLQPQGCLVWQYPELNFVKKIDINTMGEESTTSLSETAIATENNCHTVERAIHDKLPVVFCEQGLFSIYEMIIKNYFEQKAEVIELSEVNLLKDVKLDELMNEVKHIITSFNMLFLLEDWKSIYRGIHNYGFNVVVIGEFSRGKSTLINKILGKEILPVSNLPTTTMLTKIKYSPIPGIDYINHNGTKEWLPLESQSWEKLVIHSTGDDPEGFVEVNVPEAWLNKTKIRILDTPGAGDLNDKRINVVTDAIIGCDGVIIAINATMPLSLSEKGFIEQHITSKKVPHIILVITRLDQVEFGARTCVIDYIIEKLASWEMTIPVHIPQDDIVLDSEKYKNITGITKIKAAIEGWQQDSRHAELKITGFYACIQGLLETIKVMLKKEQEVISLSRTEKLVALEKEKMNVQKHALLWEDYRLTMMKWSIQCIEWMKSQVHERENRIIERLQFELMHANSPKIWWDNDLPYRLKQEMLNVSRALEDGLQKKVLGDLKWLNDRIMKDFSVLFNMDIGEISTKMNITDASLLNNDMSDNNKLRMFMRVGAGAATILGYTLFGPFGIVMSVGGGIISEILMGNSIDKQKEELKILIGKVVNTNFDHALETSENRIQGVYDKFVEEAVKQERLWLRGQRDALNKSGTYGDDGKEKLVVRMAMVQRLIDKIEMTLKR